MKTAPGSAFKVVQAQVTFGALKVLLDVQEGADQVQTGCAAG